MSLGRHPGIDFRFVTGGRSAFVTGTGLTVWELFRIWQDHRRDLRKVLKNYPHLKRHQVAAAVSYAAAHPEEVVRETRRAQPDEPLEAFPFLEKVKV
jgi:uncharacterized protein (DUF433 family)